MDDVARTRGDVFSVEADSQDHDRGFGVELGREDKTRKTWMWQDGRRIALQRHTNQYTAAGGDP